MNLKLSKLLPVSLCLLMSGDQTSSPASGYSCATGNLSCEVERYLQGVGADEGDQVQFVLAAGPNRIRSLSVAVEAINRVVEDTQYQVSVVLRVDVGEMLVPLRLDDLKIDSADSRWDLVVGNLGPSVEGLLCRINWDVEQILQVQEMGTSYTEVADSVAGTNADHLVFSRIICL